MQLSIRWKFILSIGITLIVTYLGLLTWDYWWQRRTAASQMQQMVSERAETLASSANDRLGAIESSIANVTNAISGKPPTSEDALRSLVAPLQSTPALRNPATELFIAFDAQYAAGANLRPAYMVNLNDQGSRSIGGGGGRGGGRGGRGGRGGQGFEDRNNPGGPDDFRGGRGGQPSDQRGGRNNNVRGIQFDRGGRGGGPQDGEPNMPPPDGGGRGGGPGFGPRGGGGGPFGGGPPLIEPINNFDPAAEQFYLRAVELKRPVWTDPHFIRAGNIGMQARTTFSYPIIVNDKVIGVVAAATTVNPGGRFGMVATTRPAEAEASGLLREYSIIGNEGRVIFPLPARSQQRESIVDWAKANNQPDLAADLTATIEGENSAVKVYRLQNAPDILPGAQAGQYYWVAFAPIATTDWVVTSAISEAEYMSPIVQRLWHRALFLIGGLVVLLCVTTFVSIRVSRPIEKMARAVNELAAGNLDAHVTEVDSTDEVGQLASAFNTMTGQLKQHVAALTEQTAARETVEAELRIARQIQTDLLPKTFPPFPNRSEFDLHAINVPAHRVAGDFYDFFFASDDLLTIVIADVSGKGVPAALLMAVTRTIIRNLAMEGLSPRQIAERANSMLLQDISDSMFVTMFLCLYDTRTGRVVYVNAGHPKPYRFGLAGEPEPFGDITGALLGVCPTGSDWQYEQHEGQLEVGQTLLLYTDGVTEARSPNGDMLRSSGVEAMIRQHQTESVANLCNDIVQDLNTYQAGQPADDITLVALRRTR